MRPIEVTEKALKLPGTCSKCLSSNRDYFVDTGMDMEFGGVLYFCNICITEIVRMIPDFMTKKDVDDIISASNDMMTAVKKDKEVVEKIITTLKEFGIDVDKLLTLTSKAKEAVDTKEQDTRDIKAMQHELGVYVDKEHELSKQLAELSYFKDHPNIIADRNSIIAEVSSERDKAFRDIKDRDDTIIRLMQNINELTEKIAELTAPTEEEVEAEKVNHLVKAAISL